jgi:hypothetical protein
MNNLQVAYLLAEPLPLSEVSKVMLYMYSCSQCDFKTHIEGMFKQHVDSNHLGLIQATLNSQSNSSNILLSNNFPNDLTIHPQQLHVQQHEQQLVLATPKIEPATPTSTPSPIFEETQKCPKCDFEAPSKYQLAKHHKKTHGKNSTVTAFLQPEVQQQQQVEVPQQQQLRQSPPTPATMPAKKTYSCSACPYSTSRRDGLSQHFDSVHLKIKNHQCTLCPYVTSQKGTLNRHVKLRHKRNEVTSP